MSEETLSILTNQEVIAVNQDVQGKPGRRVYQNDSTEVWIRQLNSGNYAVVLFNRDNVTRDLTLQWSYIGLPPDQPAHLRDIWLHKDIGIYLSSYTVPVPTHDVVMLLVSQQPGGLVQCTQVLMSDCNPDDVNQTWVVSNSDHTIRSKACGLCLDVYDCQTDKPKNVQVYECHVGQQGCGSYNEEWSVNSNGTITTMLDGKCLTVLADGSDMVQTEHCGSAPTDQVWSVDSKRGEIVNKSGGEGANKCLTVK